MEEKKKVIVIHVGRSDQAAVRKAMAALDYAHIEARVVAHACKTLEEVSGKSLEEIYGRSPILQPIEIPFFASPTGRTTEYLPLEIPKDQLPKISKGKQSKFTRQPWQQHGKRRKQWKKPK